MHMCCVVCTASIVLTIDTSKLTAFDEVIQLSSRTDDIMSLAVAEVILCSHNPESVSAMTNSDRGFYCVDIYCHLADCIKFTDYLYLRY